MALLTSTPVTAVAGLEAVAAVIGSVHVVQQIRSRKISQVERAAADVITLILADGTRIEVPSAQFRLAADPGFRRALNGMVRPLSGDGGVNSLTVAAAEQSATVTETDIPAFDIPPSRAEELGESITEVVIRPLNVSFTDGKWRFSDGETTFFASIEDPRFSSAVEVGSARFAKNDMFRVRLRTRQTRDGSGLHTEHAVVEVLEHIVGMVQLDLFSALAAGPPESPQEPQLPSRQ